MSSWAPLRKEILCGAHYAGRFRLDAAPIGVASNLGTALGEAASLAAVLLAAAVLPQAVSAIAAASSRAVILVIFMFLTSLKPIFRCVFQTTTEL